MKLSKITLKHSLLPLAYQRSCLPPLGVLSYMLHVDVWCVWTAYFDLNDQLMLVYNSGKLQMSTRLTKLHLRTETFYEVFPRDGGFLEGFTGCLRLI